MSNDFEELKVYLEAMQKIRNKKDSNLSQDEKNLVDEIVGYAQTKQVLEPEVDENGIKPNFTLDYGIKELLSKLSDKYLIDAINYLEGSKFKTNRKLQFAFTEYFDTTGDNNKYFIRGDLSAIVKNGKKDEMSNVVLIELQAKHDKKVPYRMHSYGNNNLKLEKMEIKSVVDGEEVKVTQDVHIRPFEMIIYTSTAFKEKEGVFKFHVSSPHFENNGVEQFAKNGDVTTYLIPFINIFQMSLDELRNSKFFFLQCVYLYKYKQDKSLLENAEITKIAEEIEKDLEEKLSTEDFSIVMKQHWNLYADIYNIVEANQVKYRKVYDDMLAVKDTFYDKMQREGELKGELKGKIEMVLNMFKERLPDETIARCSELTIEEISKIREENFKI